MQLCFGPTLNMLTRNMPDSVGCNTLLCRVHRLSYVTSAAVVVDLGTRLGIR